MTERICTKPGFSKLERWTRLRTAQQFVGKRVTVTHKYLTDPVIWTGVVLAGARSLAGYADVLILAAEDRDGVSYPEPEAFAISMAQITKIEEIA